ncbi:hypothetical protein DPEC_G00074370 [Dallia pectoralis]|uniref:Uncharacterized protein n=1 Tax=Dallia pectoralis TaxID=75939 RepID=A0ACC2H3R2_DALPE|nr:hypothetical protein DPEC_G00074370 [Dallia pectoralis]
MRPTYCCSLPTFQQLQCLEPMLLWMERKVLCLVENSRALFPWRNLPPVNYEGTLTSGPQAGGVKKGGGQEREDGVRVVS